MGVRGAYQAAKGALPYQQARALLKHSDLPQNPKSPGTTLTGGSA